MPCAGNPEHGNEQGVWVEGAQQLVMNRYG